MADASLQLVVKSSESAGTVSVSASETPIPRTCCEPSSDVAAASRTETGTCSPVAIRVRSASMLRASVNGVGPSTTRASVPCDCATRDAMAVATCARSVSLASPPTSHVSEINVKCELPRPAMHRTTERGPSAARVSKPSGQFARNSPLSGAPQGDAP